MMLPTQLPVLLLAVSTVIAAPATTFDDIPEVIVPQKRAALVLDRLLVALQKALREDNADKMERPDYDGPRAQPLRFAHVNDNELLLPRGEGAVARSSGWLSKEILPSRPAQPWRRTYNDDTSSLQRRNQGPAGRGRVLRCYFNAITCF